MIFFRGKNNVDFVNDQFQSDSITLSCGAEHKVRGKKNVLLQQIDEKVMINYAYYVPCWRKIYFQIVV